MVFESQVILRVPDTDLVYTHDGEVRDGFPKIFSSVGAAKIARSRSWRAEPFREKLKLYRVEIVLKEELT